MNKAFNPSFPSSILGARTIAFIRTRTVEQWLVAVAWWIVLGSMSYLDWRQEKHVLAVLELVAYAIIFGGAIYLAQGRKNMKSF